MAKRSTKTNGNGKPVVEVKPAVSEQVGALIEIFKAKYNRVPRLDFNELQGIFERGPDEPNEEWYLSAMSDDEQAKLRAIAEKDQEQRDRGKVSINKLLEFVNSDTELQAYAEKVAEAKDLPSKAPATIAFRLSKDMDSTALASFAVPGSKEAESKDGDGNKLGDNEKTGYRWDYYDHPAIGGNLKGSWFLDFVDGTTAGIRINKILQELDINKNHTAFCMVTIDGVTMDVQTMQTQQRTNFNVMLKGRRNSMAAAYRKAVQVIQMMSDLNERCGNKYNDEGKISEIGKVKAEFVLLDPQNPNSSITPSKRPIRVHSLLQQDIITKQGDKEIVASFAGYPSGTYQDMLVSEFTNISIDGAIALAAKAGKEKASYIELVTAKKVKVTPTPAGDGKGQTQEAQAEAKLPTAKATAVAFSNIRIQMENEGWKKAFLELFTTLPGDQARQLCYDAVKLEEFLDKEVITDGVMKTAADVEKEVKDKEQKERDEKLAKLTN
jgi:hypothetical protein